MSVSFYGNGIQLSGATSSAQRPADAPTNFVWYNASVGCLEIKNSSGGWTPVDINDGSSSGKAVDSALYLKNTLGITTSGAYWINVNGTPYQLYCEMTTDGGGWMKIMECTGALTDSGDVSVSYLTTAAVDTNAKLSDSGIKYLSKYNGYNEWMLATPTSCYICRYTSSNWDAWSASGATNMTYASKSSNGTWTDYIYNGHFNNRGFSTYSDNNGNSCPTVFAGVVGYYCNYHTQGGAPGAPFSVYVR